MESTLDTSTISFLEAAGYKRDEIARMGPHTGLQTDLRLDGDNLIEIVEVLSTKFHVDLSDFNLAKYGHDEGFYIRAKHMLYAMRGRDPMEGRKIITLAMIEESLRLGRWADH
jgi:hypothetical protein